jgi:putative oxidoreductase
MQAWGPLVLRIATGVIFVAHGLTKLLPILGGGPGETARQFAAMGLEPAYALGLAVGVVETLGGAATVVGAFTSWVAPALILDMLVAVARVHLDNGFFLNWTLAPGRGHGYEFDMLLIAALACLLLTGPGALSVDGWRTQSAEREKLGRARLRARVG